MACGSIEDAITNNSTKYTNTSQKLRVNINILKKNVTNINLYKYNIKFKIILEISIKDNSDKS